VAGAHFGLYWKLEAGVLVPKAHFQVDGYMESIKAKKKIDGDYIAEAYATKIMPGQGLVGRVAMTGKSTFYSEIKTLSKRDFLRVKMARTCGIKSVAFIAMPGGEIMELCSVTGWDSMPCLDDHEVGQDLQEELLSRVVVLEKDVSALKLELAHVKKLPQEETI